MTNGSGPCLRSSFSQLHEALSVSYSAAVFAAGLLTFSAAWTVYSHALGLSAADRPHGKFHSCSPSCSEASQKYPVTGNIPSWAQGALGEMQP